MSYEVFKAKVNALIRKSGLSENVRFFENKHEGKYFANCPDEGVTIVGRSGALRVSVIWGSGHLSMAKI